MTDEAGDTNGIVGLSKYEKDIMPCLRVKRPHTKVRSGCVTCKRRRLKVWLCLSGQRERKRSTQANHLV